MHVVCYNVRSVYYCFILYICVNNNNNISGSPTLFSREPRGILSPVHPLTCSFSYESCSVLREIQDRSILVRSRPPLLGLRSTLAQLGGASRGSCHDQEVRGTSPVSCGSWTRPPPRVHAPMRVARWSHEK